MEKQNHSGHVEAVADTADFEITRVIATGAHVEQRLLDGDNIILIPTPSLDPKDPLNYPSWKKWAILVLVSAYGCTSVLLSSGMGAIFTVVVQSYPGQEQRATDLLVYPTIFMGLGNLISMPLALAIGRRPVFLASMALLVVSGIWCTFSKSLDSHIAGRNIMSLAAGQSEALAPLIVQEVHFLHEKRTKLSWFVAIQNVAVGAFFIATQFLVAAYGWRWWYGLFTIINGVLFLLSILFVAKSTYDRAGVVPEQKTLKNHKVAGQKWNDGLKFINIEPGFGKIPRFYVQLVQGFAMPTVVWAPACQRHLPWPICSPGVYLCHSAGRKIPLRVHQPGIRPGCSAECRANLHARARLCWRLGDQVPGQAQQLALQTRIPPLAHDHSSHRRRGVRHCLWSGCNQGHALV